MSRTTLVGTQPSALLWFCRVTTQRAAELLLELGMELEVKHPTSGPVGSYTVRGLRARGGQGHVYILTGPSGRPAVLKVPGPRGLLASEVERRILLNMPQHRNIVRLIGTAMLNGIECAVLSWAHENPFLRLNDPRLNEATKRFRVGAPRTPLPPTTAIEMVNELLTALEHMHRHGFVHGDIKSANVLVELATTKTYLSNRSYFAALQQRAYRTCLVDFGSTRSIAFLKTMDTKDEAVAPSEYTPLYAPPEVIPGIGSDRGGPHVDVYQIGLLLYQWTSGHFPYDHAAPASIARDGLSNELMDLKRQERTGVLRPFDPARVRAARNHDVVFAEAFASQRLRDRFFEDLITIIESTTKADPAQRPTVPALRAEIVRLFELEAPAKDDASKRQLVVSMWNTRWHLTRTNRLAEASRVLEPQRPGAPAPRPSGSGPAAAPLGPASGAHAHPTPPPAPPAPQGHDRSDRAERPTQTISTGPASQAHRAATGAHPNPAHTELKKTASGRVAVSRDEPVGNVTPEVLDPPSTMDGQPSSAPVGAVEPITRPGVTGATDPITGGVSAAEKRPGIKVALVDDDKVTLAILSRSLRRRGYLVRTFQDPESALDVLCHDAPDVAIVDMQMPGITGIELIRQLEHRLGGLPFPLLVLSSVEDEKTLQAAFRYGVADYLIKPVTEGELAVKLDQAIAKHKDSLPEAIPRELGGLELQEELRRGEVALLFRALDTWDPDVSRVVKVLRPDLGGDAEPLLKLRREIDVLARCDHPGIPRLHTSGLCGRLLFYAADTIPTRSLGEWIREQGRLDVPGTAKLLRSAASALEHLHGRSVLVSDLTPESLGVTANGDIMVMELGNARWIRGGPRGDEPTPLRTRYTAPEWFTEPPHPDLRSDLFALGMSALEAYAGRPAPRAGPNGPADPRPLADGLPQGLAQLLLSLVARAPSERPPHAAAVLEALDRLRL